MELDLLITELDATTIQLDKMRYLATQISNKASEKTQRAKMHLNMILRVVKFSSAAPFY